MRRIGFWHQPTFWWKSQCSFLAHMLSPLGSLIGAWTACRSFLGSSSKKSGLPVLCVGSFSVGGTGKTPVAQAIARVLIEKGAQPAFITRGYGGRLGGPVRVDLMNHRAVDVGDEALLLAQTALTIVSRNRFSGAQCAEALGADILILDDGLYNSSLHHDLRLAVVDGGLGIGNGYVTPAGPLRASLHAQASCVHGICLIAPITPAADSVVSWAVSQNIPLMKVCVVPSPREILNLEGRSVLAFTGIGHPKKFFDTLKNSNVQCSECYAYGDHHLFSYKDILFLAKRVQATKLIPVTTEKDNMRLSVFLKTQTLGISERRVICDFLSRLRVLPIQVQWMDTAVRDHLLSGIYSAPERRSSHTSYSTTC